MRLQTPRIAALSDAELTPEQLEIVKPVQGTEILNLFRTLVRIPDALSALKSWGAYVVSRRQGLTLRDAEVIILRTGWLCKSGYEWNQHSRVAERAGFTGQEIERIKAGADAPGWTERERALIRACDDLNADQHISDASWAGLKAHLTEAQCMDLVFLVAQYTQIAMMLNSFGVQLEAGKTVDPDLRFY